MSTQTCATCTRAAWKRTDAGRLHPSGDGRCGWVLVLPPIPKAFRWAGSTISDPNPLAGGYINRHRPLKFCDFWEGKP